MSLNHYCGLKKSGWKLKKAIEEGRLDDFGRLLDEHWQVKNNVNKMSDPKIDRLYSLAKDCGALGERFGRRWWWIFIFYARG